MRTSFFQYRLRLWFGILGVVLAQYALVIPCEARTQLGNWLGAQWQLPLGRQTGLYFETHVRSDELLHQFYLVDYRGGLEFEANRFVEFSAIVGQQYSFDRNENFGDLVRRETRFFEQAVFKIPLGALVVEPRLRVEHRFFDDGSNLTRVRQRLRLSLPHKLSFGTELFLNDQKGYEATRLTLVKSMGSSAYVNWMPGLVYQHNWQDNEPDQHSVFLQFTVSWNFGSSKNPHMAD
jgi:hypothetical protein